MSLLDRPDRLFAVASLIFGLGLAAVTPPFQVPDEPAHFYRAYLVSTGRLRVLPTAANRAELPESLPRLAVALLGDAPSEPERTIAPRAILDALSTPLAPSRRVVVVFPSGLQYTFVPYLPQAVGIGIGRLLGAPALALLYCARLANLLVGTLAIWAAIRLLPGLRWPMVLLAMTPMALALRASASVDATTIGAALLLTAAVARLIWGSAPPRRRDLVALAGAAGVLCASKPPYLPLALLVCLVPRTRWPASPDRPSTWSRPAFLAGYFVTLGALATWSVATARAVGALRPGAGVDPERQMAAMVADPLGVLHRVAADYLEHAPRYLAHFVGHLGWLDTRLPIWFLVAYLALLLAVTLLDDEGGIEVLSRQRAILASCVVCGLLLVSASQYASFTPIGAAFVEGIQGRYFIPLAPAGMWALRGVAVRGVAPRIAVRAVPVAVAVFAVLAFVAAVGALLERFYGL